MLSSSHLRVSLSEPDIVRLLSMGRWFKLCGRNSTWKRKKKDFCYILFVSREFSSSRLLAPVQLHGGGGVGGQRGGRGGARVPGVAEHEGLRKI